MGKNGTSKKCQKWGVGKKDIKREQSDNEGDTLSMEAGVETQCFNFHNIYKNEKYITLTQTS